MDVECEVEVASTSDRSWLFKSDQCIICSGDKRKEKEKLNSISETGMKSIRDACELQRRTDLLEYLDANPNVQHLVHHSCRTSFKRAKACADMEPVITPTVRLLRSGTGPFRRKDHCVLCIEHVDTKDKGSRKVETLSSN